MARYYCEDCEEYFNVGTDKCPGCWTHCEKAPEDHRLRGIIAGGLGLVFIVIFVIKVVV
jgi:hypothetical protein